MATITPIFTGRSDLTTLEISAPSMFTIKAKRFYIVNFYSVWGSTATERTISPTFALPSTPFSTLVVGDFNIHHPSADLIRRHNFSKLKTSFPYFSRAAEHGYTLLNTRGVHTHFLLQGLSRPSVLDLVFVSSPLMPFFQDWTTDLPSTGFDHVAITIMMAYLIAVPNWVRTDRPLLKPLLEEHKFPPLRTSLPDTNWRICLIHTSTPWSHS